MVFFCVLAGTAGLSHLRGSLFTDGRHQRKRLMIRLIGCFLSFFEILTQLSQRHCGSLVRSQQTTIARKQPNHLWFCRPS
jgi:hypothetical protein